MEALKHKGNTMTNFTAIEVKYLSTTHLIAKTYSAGLYSSLVSQVGVDQEITITLPLEEGESTPATLVVQGFLASFEPQESEEGSAPQANIVVVISNRDPSTGAEVAPVYTAGS